MASLLCGWLKRGVAAAAVGAMGLVAAGQVALTKVYLEGETLAGGGSMASIDAARIGPGGHLVLRGQLAGSPVRRAVVAGLPGQLATVVAEGDAAPGLGAGVTFDSFLDTWVDSAGRVLVRANVEGTGITTTNNLGLWIWQGGAGTLIVRREAQAPLLPAGTIISNFGTPTFNNGRVAFAATLGGIAVDENNRALWRWSNNTFALVARKGSASLVSGETWTTLGDPEMNASGQMVFNAQSSFEAVLVTGAPGTLVEVARETDLVPDPALTGLRYAGAFTAGLSISSTGELAFVTNLSGTGVNGDNFRVLWRRTAAGVVRAVIRQGGTVDIPGVATDPAVSDFAFASTAGTGQTCWVTNLTGTGVTAENKVAVVRNIGTSMQVVLRQGQQAPAEAPGVVFGNDFQPTVYGAAPTINGSGILLIRGGLRNTGVPASNGLGLWGSDPQANGGALFKVVREGDLVQTGPGVMQPVTELESFDAGSTQDGGDRVFNDAGTAVMVLSFGASVQGVYTASLVGGPVLGACCRGATCQASAAGACTGANALFAGVGSACNAPGVLDTPCCIADFNHTGGVTVQDVFDYLAAWFAQSATADVNGVGGITVQDVFDYLAAWFAGC